MAFTVSDFDDLRQLLAEHPEWRTELRRLLLTEDFEALPRIVRELAEAQRDTEQRLAELAEAQRRTEQRLAELAEAQRRTEERLVRLEEIVGQLAEAQRRVEERLARLEDRVDKIEVKLARVDGRTLELMYREKAASYLGPWLRRTEVVGANDVIDLVEDHLQDY